MNQRDAGHTKMNTNLPILNRDFKMPDDGWYHVAPLGEFPHPSSGLIQVVDAPSVTAMANRFATESKAENFPGLLTDFDHFSNDPSQPSAAAGWIYDLQNRDTGLWAKIRWSDLGQEAVIGGRYRLVSPVWNRSDCEDLGNNRVRPMRLDRVALTNDPNLKGLTPLTNRADATGEIKNYGTSEGAKKGWDTRGRGKKPRVAARKSKIKEAKVAKEKEAPKGSGLIQKTRDKLPGVKAQSKTPDAKPRIAARKSKLGITPEKEAPKGSGVIQKIRDKLPGMNAPTSMGRRGLGSLLHGNRNTFSGHRVMARKSCLQS
jgi:phage I-like protein